MTGYSGRQSSWLAGMGTAEFTYMPPILCFLDEGFEKAKGSKSAIIPKLWPAGLDLFDAV